jgi:hypothetical protein
MWWNFRKGGTTAFLIHRHHHNIIQYAQSFIRKNSFRGLYQNYLGYAIISNCLLMGFLSSKTFIWSLFQDSPGESNQLALFMGTMTLSLILYGPMSLKNLLLADTYCHKKKLVRGPKESFPKMAYSLLSNQCFQ